MNPRVEILGADGRPMRGSHDGRRVRASQDAPHRGGDTYSNRIGAWRPSLGSADADLLPNLEMLVGRQRDIARNEGFASGVMQSHLDSVIGSSLRLAAKPDYRVLGLDAEWAAEWGRDAEAKFKAWANDPRKYCDASRQSTFGGLLGLGYRSLLLNGTTLASMAWLDKPRAGWHTAIQMIEPDRLSNPRGQMDSEVLRAGVVLEQQYGAEIGYWIQRSHPGDALLSLGRAGYEWDYVPRETDWGRPVMIHFHEVERIGQHRGKPIMAPVLEHMKQLWRFRTAELDAALINAIFAAVIESPFDSTLLDEGSTDNPEMWGQYQSDRRAYRDQNPLRLDGGQKIPTLFPGEKLNFLTANRPVAAFEAFEASALRNVAAATGQTYEQVSRDWSKTNYSSARGAMLDSWRGFYNRREVYGANIATPIYACWLEEAIDNGTVKLPPGAPSFHAAYGAWTGCRWLGKGMGMIDRLKEADAIGRELELHTTTLEEECAENGMDWDEVLQQRARELKRAKELGLPDAQPAPMGRMYPSDPAPNSGAKP